ncbi:unnamed protein product, partial [Chrysoparadoxa australica]
ELVSLEGLDATMVKLGTRTRLVLKLAAFVIIGTTIAGVSTWAATRPGKSDSPSDAQIGGTNGDAGSDCLIRGSCADAGESVDGDVEVIIGDDGEMEVRPRPPAQDEDEEERVVDVDAELGEWAPLADLPEAPGRLTAEVVGDVLYAFGSEAEGTMVYDILNDQWALEGDRPLGGDNACSAVAYEQALPAQQGRWEVVPTSNNPTGREEGCFVQANGKLYLIGGRDAPQVEELDPSAPDKTWVGKAFSPVQLHHMQCVAIGPTIYVGMAWEGPWPDEGNVPNIWTYNTITDQWAEGDAIPGDRQRGAGAAVAYDGKIVFAAGGIGGHEGVAQTMVDMYDPQTGAWQELPDITDARDHAHGALIGDTFCISGGRADGVNVDSTECLDLSAPLGTPWYPAPGLPTLRGGSSMAATCDGGMIVAGGEGPPAGGPAWPWYASTKSEKFDVASNTWNATPDLQMPRHGTQATTLGCDIYIAGGQVEAAGGPYAFTLEVYRAAALPAGVPKIYLFGGTDEEATGKVQVYDTAMNTWEQLNDMPWAGGAASCAMVGDFIHVLGGMDFDEGEVTTNHYRFNPSNGDWVKLADVPVARHQAATGVDGRGRLWVFGGFDDEDVGSNDVHFYDPVIDEWKQGPEPLRK